MSSKYTIDTAGTKEQQPVEDSASGAVVVAVDRDQDRQLRPETLQQVGSHNISEEIRMDGEVAVLAAANTVPALPGSTILSRDEDLIIGDHVPVAGISDRGSPWNESKVVSRHPTAMSGSGWQRSILVKL